MSKAKDLTLYSTETDPGLSDEQRAVQRVAYHDGPPEITFYGINWRRGEAQVVTDEAWAVIQARGDFREFDFRTINPHPNLPPDGEGAVGNEE